MRATPMKTALITAALALALAGCKKPAPEAQDSDVSNALTEVPADTELAIPPAEVVPVPAAPVAEAPPAPVAIPVERTVREVQQIEEDAEASGMTARLPAERDLQPAEEQAEEAQDKE